MKLHRLFQSGLLIAVSVPVIALALSAAPIDLSILNPDRIGAPGGTFTFSGTITNNTGDTLNATDLFLNFSGFDPVDVTLNQLLGASSFTIVDGSTSPVLDLFTFALAPTAGAGTYPADVVLQTASLDSSDPQRVSIAIVPEAPSLALTAVAIGLLLAGLWRKRPRVAFPLMLLTALGSQAGLGQVSAVRFTTGLPGFGRTGSTLMVAVPITNSGTLDALNVQVTGVTLGTALVMSPTIFPVAIGTIASGHQAVFQASVAASPLAQSTPYLLTVRGTYQTGGATAGFAVNRFVTVPPASPGSGTEKTGTAAANTVVGAPYPAQPPQFNERVNVPLPPIPTGPFVPGTTTPTGTGVTPLPSAVPGVRAGVFAPAAAVQFSANSSVGFTSAGTNCSPGVSPSSCAEPSGATGGGVVFVTANWTAGYSTDGGSTFKQLNPTTIFPSDAIGFCCDQIIQYVPTIDRFIWLLQGGGGVRIASASPAQIMSSSGTAWTYWNLPPGTYGQPAGTGFDYPDMAVGNNSLYLSWDVGFPSCPAGCNSGLEVTRIPLAQIQAGGTIFFNYTTPSDSSLAWGSHLTQDTGDEIFWAGHDGNSSLRVFSWAEGSNTYFWRTVTISSWPNNTLSSTTPDSQDWLNFGFPGSGVIGATRSINDVWFAWTAGTNNTFKQPHIEMVALNRTQNFQKSQQVQVWNNNFAFAYPALSTNFCTGEIGMSLGYGGGGNYENHAVGIWGDFLVYITTNSNLGVNRYGDYMSIRQNDLVSLDGLFNAFGYGISSLPGGGMQSDVRYVTFGRPCILR